MSCVIFASATRTALRSRLLSWLVRPFYALAWLIPPDQLVIRGGACCCAQVFEIPLLNLLVGLVIATIGLVIDGVCCTLRECPALPFASH